MGIALSLLGPSVSYLEDQLGVSAVGFVWVFVVQRSISRASGLHRTSVLRQA